MATQADIDRARATLDQLQHDADDAEASLHGGKFNTLLDAFHHIGQNFWHSIGDMNFLKVEGGFQKIQIGISNNVVAGFKGEFVKPLSKTLIGGIEIKTVVGVASTTIDGAKSDTIQGAKVDLLGGLKFERIGAGTTAFGESPKMENKALSSDKMTGMNQKIGNLTLRAAKYLFKSIQVNEQIGGVEGTYGDLTQKLGTLRQEMAKLEEKLGDYKVPGATDWSKEASSITISSGGLFKANGGGSQFELLPSQIIVKAGGCHFGPTTAGVVFSGTTYRFI
jgi:hypothetical protein